MKQFIISCSISLIICLIFHYFTPAFTTNAPVNVSAAGKPDSLSQAYTLSFHTVHSDKIPAYQSYYYCVPYFPSITVSLTSTQIKHLNVSFFSDSGKKLTHTAFVKARETMICSLTEHGNGQYIFIKLTNQAALNLSIHLSAKKTKKIVSPAPSPSQTIKNKKIFKNATSTPAPTPTSNPTKKASLYPHFLCIKQGCKKKLTIKGGKDIFHDKTYRWSSTNPNIAIVKKQLLYGLSEGTAIIYLQSKNPAIANSTCLVRVISNERGDLY